MVIIPGDPEKELVKIVAESCIKINQELSKSNFQAKDLNVNQIRHLGEVIAESANVYDENQLLGNIQFELVRLSQSYSGLVHEIRNIMTSSECTQIKEKVERIIRESEIEVAVAKGEHCGKRVKEYYEGNVKKLKEEFRVDYNI